MKLASLSLLLLVILLRSCPSISVTDAQDAAALKALAQAWAPTSFSWSGDPCESLWLGVTCDNSSSSKVINLQLPAQGLHGTLPSQIGDLVNLQILDLSYNGNLTGSLPSELFSLVNLGKLILQNCGLSGTIPDDLGKLVKLTFLALNQNSFTGSLPTTISGLTEVVWFDVSNNQLSGNLPQELSFLTKAQHFHLQVNGFSGIIPAGIFSAKQPLLHLLLYNNSFQGPVPSDIGDLPDLDILRLDSNQFASVPENLTKLVTVTSIQLDHNSLTGDVPDLSGLESLQAVNLGNNAFTSGPLPSWISQLANLTTLAMEDAGLQGELPADLFTLQQLESVMLGYNSLNGTLDLSLAGPNLEEVHVQQNNLTGLTAGNFTGILDLRGNNLCLSNPNQPDNACVNATVESAPPNAPPCECSSGLSPNPSAAASGCLCSYPVSGFLSFTALKVPLNVKTAKELQTGFAQKISVLTSEDQVSILVTTSTTVNISIYPNKVQYWDAGAANLVTAFISGKVVLFDDVGPYVFFPSGPYFPPASKKKSGLSAGGIAGISIGVAAGVLLIALFAVYGCRQRKRAEKAEEISKPYTSWVSKQDHSVAAPKIQGARLFTLAEMKKATNNFSKSQEIGAGGYGKVYKATLPSGEEVAIKRSQASSQQGAVEFKNEIELLSRVHHRNLVHLVGFCFDEQMLVYQFLPNGTLDDALSGRSNIVLDWPTRLKIAEGSARGLAYLHTEANPPIIHRDVKSSNILLDVGLVAKVADFGLSKLGPEDGGHGHVSTQVKGTLGYLDPEYYSTQRLSDRSDVYSFGVVILELLTSRKPIEHGKFIVREVKTALQRGGLSSVRESLLDPQIKSCPDSQLQPLLDLALRCTEDSVGARPSMKQVTKEIEAVTGEYEEGYERRPSQDYFMKKEDPQAPYYNSSSFQYSGAYGTAKVEPK